MYDSYVKYLANLHNSRKYRKLVDSGQGDINKYLDFSTNDYLNLSKNKLVIEAACLAAKNYGTGATGSRLLSGNFEPKLPELYVTNKSH